MQMIANDSYIVFEINAYDGLTAIGGIAPFPLPSVQKKQIQWLKKLFYADSTRTFCYEIKS